MKSTAKVAAPPPRPLMIYDGDCNFCKLWIQRWQSATGDRVDYVPFQDPRIARDFPEISQAQFQAAVHLIEPDGSVCSGAEAVFQSRNQRAPGRWLAGLYRRFRGFARVAEWLYGFVARNRTGFSAVTRLLWGRNVEPPSHRLVRSAFVRSMGVIYLIAFVSLWTQILGLAGSNGILPVAPQMEAMRQQADAANIGLDRYRLVPTFCWFNASDRSLTLQCSIGAAAALLLIAGIAPALCLALLWLVYLSLCTATGVFLGYQWDALLLEAGFLAIFFAPGRWLSWEPSREAEPSRIILWLLRWLLFGLMFRSGVVKLLSGDETWRNLTALNYHYETQPLPTWIGWHAHQLPEWFHRSDTIMMFVIELAAPFLIFLPRRPRMLAALAFVALQIFIMLAGNYCFFNLLTLALCMVLLDDAALGNCWSACKRCLRRNAVTAREPLPPPRRSRAWLVATLPVALVVLVTSYVHVFGTVRGRPEFFGPVARWIPEIKPALSLYGWWQPLRSFNSYGLFAVMTTTRPEIIVEGSNDGVSWTAYEFKYKAGDLKRRPRFVAPHQPRLDWQMWFAALGDARGNPWFVNFCVRLLQGSPDVLALMEHNPFPDQPPRFIRAVTYEYHFSDRAARSATGEWWRREYKSIYLDPISLREGTPGSSSAR